MVHFRFRFRLKRNSVSLPFHTIKMTIRKRNKNSETELKRDPIYKRHRNGIETVVKRDPIYKRHRNGIETVVKCDQIYKCHQNVTETGLPGRVGHFNLIVKIARRFTFELGGAACGHADSASIGTFPTTRNLSHSASIGTLPTTRNFSHSE